MWASPGQRNQPEREIARILRPDGDQVLLERGGAGVFRPLIQPSHDSLPLVSSVPRPIFFSGRHNLAHEVSSIVLPLGSTNLTMRQASAGGQVR